MNEYLLDSPVLSRILIPYIYTGLQRLSPPRGAGWELRAYRTIPRAEQGHRWSCRWGRGGTLGLVPLVVEVAGRDRTEDYQQSRVSKPPNVRFATAKPVRHPLLL